MVLMQALESNYRVYSFGVLLSLLMGWSSNLLAQTTSEQMAYQAYKAKQFEQAQSAYEDVSGFDGMLGFGASAYRLQDYAQSAEAFRQAANYAKTDAQRAAALFNLGNSYLHLQGLAQAVDYAIESYQQALLYQPDLQAAQHNLRIAQQLQQQKNQQALSQQGQSGEDQEGEGENGKGQGQGAGERAGKLDLDGNYVGGAGEKFDAGDSTDRVFLPIEQAKTEFDLGRTDHLPSAESSLDSLAGLQQQVIDRQRAEKFTLELQTMDLQQQTLLHRMLEREEGFQAKQATSQPIPGVEPW